MVLFVGLSMEGSFSWLEYMIQRNEGVIKEFEVADLGFGGFGEGPNEQTMARSD
jgi:hypothetical protein